MVLWKKHQSIIYLLRLHLNNWMDVVCNLKVKLELNEKISLPFENELSAKVCVFSYEIKLPFENMKQSLW